ncbi:MAG: ABC transporter ATP-binding protein, partial [Clostridia bacterium]|nr:ABC transporter ATP-binding protein [Clostridia bacterium]
ACTWVIMEMSRLVCLTFTGILAFKGKISVGEVVLYQTYFGQIVSFVNNLLNLYPQITKGMESINSIGEILYDEEVETDNAIIPIPEMKGQVEFTDVCYRYAGSDMWTLKNFTLSVKEGESIAFVGASGAGKSTLLDLLIGFDRPQEGQILIDRVNMMNLDMAEYRSHLAVVPQNTILFAGSFRDNVTYGLDRVTDEDVNRVMKSVGLDELIETLPEGIYTQLGEHGGKLSGGQRQRISIARALLRNPKIIIFDEATSALDSASEKKVQEAVDNMMKQCTTFMVAHRLSTIRNVDRIVVLDKGEIVEIGTHDELMAKQGAFYQLKKLQE